MYLAKQDEDTKMAVIIYSYSEMACFLYYYSETKKNRFKLTVCLIVLQEDCGLDFRFKH